VHRRGAASHPREPPARLEGPAEDGEHGSGRQGFHQQAEASDDDGGWQGEVEGEAAGEGETEGGDFS